MKVIASLVMVLIFASSSAAPASDACAALDRESRSHGVLIPGAESGRTVVGKGRVQFYSEPSLECEAKGVFVVPGDRLDAYLEYKGFTYVMFMNLKSGDEATGWVESSRLKENGYGISPQK